MKKIKSILLGIICSFTCTVLLLIGFSLFLVNNNINDGLISVFIIVFFSVSILCGAIITARRIRSKGAFYGFVMSIVYIMLLYAISSLCIGDFSIQKTSIFMIISGSLLGILGGIIGVNIK